MNIKTPALWCLGLLACMSFILGLGLVWINIERTDLAYELKTLERDLQEKRDQYSKLQVERHYLLSPGTLRSQAEKAGLHPPLREQIRTLEHGRQM